VKVGAVLRLGRAGEDAQEAPLGADAEEYDVVGDEGVGASAARGGVA